ncbi:MAG TPA: uridine kinase [Prolixibacteraceae bacterium]|nr:uridine kinase [Prolixibacteraceae bacterium]HPS14107.1 uridine kinase [Prolixibacteraceae bacterium]
MIVIGIAGGTGSGKTTVVNEIVKRLPKNDVVIIPQDAYYRDNIGIPLEERQKKNYDHPDSIEFELLVKHIEKLKSGKAIDRPIYSYLTCLRSEETIRIEPRHIVIIEGILCLTQPELRDLMDIKVFVDCEPDIRLSRVIKRDIIERGRGIDQTLLRYEETVRPMHLQFIEPSKRYADIIVPQGGQNAVAINVLTQFIEKQINEKNEYHARTS